MQSASRSAAITAELRDEILRGRYRSGERLPSERDLAERFGVHRGAVREALKRLEQLGLADIRPGGARVMPIEEASLDIVEHLLDLQDPPDPVMVNQVLEVMSALFTMAARLAAERADDEQRAKILELIERLASQEFSDFHEHFRLVQQLGDRFVEAADNLVLRIVRGGLKTNFFEKIQSKMPHDPPSLAMRAPHFRRIASAIEARDGAAASEAVLELTRMAQRHALETLHASHQEIHAQGGAS